MSSETIQLGRPFGIIDMMIVTGTIAFVFMIYESSGFNRFEDHWIYLAMRFSYAFTTGTFLAALIWIPRQCARTGKFFHHPGHWILGAQTIGSLGIFTFWILRLFFVEDVSSIQDQDLKWYAVITFATAVFHLTATAVLVAAIFSSKRRWQIVMGLLAMTSLGTAILNTSYGVSILGMMDVIDPSWTSWSAFLQAGLRVFKVAPAVAIAVAVTMDLFSKPKRDWMHWIGLATTFAALTLLPLLQFVFSRMLISGAVNIS